jgi:hypothetical protein
MTKNLQVRPAAARSFVLVSVLLGSLLVPFAASAAPPSALQWKSPAASANLRIGRRSIGTGHGAVKVFTGKPKKFCKAAPAGDGQALDCRLPKVDPSYQYFVCTRSQSGEILSGLECSYHGNGGGWECTPSDIGAGWCD